MADERFLGTCPCSGLRIDDLPKKCVISPRDGSNTGVVFKNRLRLTSRSANSLFLLIRINNSLIIFIWTLILFTKVGCVNGYNEQRFAIEPQDQSAVLGSHVTLPCRVENKAGQLQWTKDDFGLGTHRHLTGYDRYLMIGSDDEGDYSLDIREVVLEDDGLYQCQVSTGPRGEQAIRSRYAKLIVLAPPDPPRILEGPVLQVIEDSEIKLECVSAGGKPAAEITWIDNEGMVLKQGVSYKVEPMTDGRRFTARSILRMRARRHHHNQSFTCQAQNTADRAYRATTTSIQVTYAPKVRVFMKTGGRISEGDTLIIGCDADANPQDISFKWFINNELVYGNNSGELVILNVSRNYHEATVKCEVYNTVGKSSESKTLEVIYGPKFIIKPQNIEAEVGTITTLSCVVDGYPQPDILWFHYDQERIIRVGKTSNLSITVNHQSAGVYWCKAKTDGFPDVEAQATVFVKGSPKIMSNTTQYGVEGDIVHLECLALSVPKPDYVMWTFAGHEINAHHNQDYGFLEETLPDGIVKSTLVIRESVSSHFGKYNCSVTNVFGTDSIEIHLMPDKRFPLILIISAGVSAAALVAVVLLLIIILCHRRRRKNVTGEVIKKPDVTHIGKGNCGDQYKESDRSSNISDLKLELRQVEGGCELDNVNTNLETEFQSDRMKSNVGIGLPLAGPVSLPMCYDNELLKQYQRYSNDFSDTSSHNLHFKVPHQNNGYVPYVDYSKDYIPPVLNSNDSLNSSMSRSIDTASTVQCNSGHSQNSSLQRLTQRQGSYSALNGLGSYNIGPDVIPMTNPAVILAGGLDVRYAATYGNPYLRANGHSQYAGHPNTANPSSTPAPPPYYALRSSTLPVTTVASPSSSSSSRPMASTSPTTSGAQPQVPKVSPQAHTCMNTFPIHGRSSQSVQITTKGNGIPVKGVTHV